MPKFRREIFCERLYGYLYPLPQACLIFIGASLSEPHTNQYYEKTAVLMYVCICMYICSNMSNTCSLAHSASAYA